MEIFNADCLEKMKDLKDDSIDLVFCDLPYGQTSCKWDCKIDLELFWKQIMRIKKLHTPIFFTTTTKFGVELITSAPKKCFFRYDIVWVKSAPAGFLSAKKMPMRKHEMIYVFYEKLPFYDLSSHKHKFIKEVPTKRSGKDGVDNVGMIKNRSKSGMEKINKYDPPLPVSVVKEEKSVVKQEPTYYMKDGKTIYNGGKAMGVFNKGGTAYEPPLPVSVVKEEIIEPNEDYDKREKKTRNTIKKEENYGKGYLDKKVNFRKYDAKLGGKGAESHLYDPPLPVSVVKEIETDKKRIYAKRHKDLEYNQRKNGESAYDPPLPVSVVKEETTEIKDGAITENYEGLYGGLKEPEPEPEESMDTLYGEIKIKELDKPRKDRTSAYEPPLPNSMLEIKSTRGKHSTEKPVALIEWLLKYYSKEGDVVLDPTMGSGSTGVACKNMNRNFIGIELDPEIYEVAVNRIEP